MDTHNQLETQQDTPNPIFDALVRFGNRYGEKHTLAEKIMDGTEAFVREVLAGGVPELDTPEAKHLATIVLDQKFNN